MMTIRHNPIPVFFLVVSAMLFAAPAAADDWPTYMHDAYRTGVSAESVSLPLNLHWVHKSRYAPSPAWPREASKNLWVNTKPLPEISAYDKAYHVVSAQGKVFFGSSSNDKVYCLDAANGRELWSFFAEGPVRFAPAVSGNRLLFGSDDGNVYCVNIPDGAFLWKRRAIATGGMFPGNQRVISKFPVRTDVLVEGTMAYFCAGLFPTTLGAGKFSVDVVTGNLDSQTTITLSPQGYLRKTGDTISYPLGRMKGTKTLFTLAKAAVHNDSDGAIITVGGVQFKGSAGQVAAGTTWSASVQGKAHSLAFASGRLFVSTDSGYLYCYGQGAAVPDTVKPVFTSYPYANSTVRQQYADAAAAILSTAGVTKGYALILDNNGGQLAYQMAVQSDLRIVCVESDSAEAASARRNLDAAGMYGRVSVHHVRTMPLPYNNFLFNIVTFDGFASGGTYTGSRDEALRVLRPYGGMAFLEAKGGVAVCRGSIQNAGEWTHYYGSPTNNPNSDDPYVGLDSITMQWFGEPGPYHRVDRHARVASPLWKNGILIVPGEEWCTGVDAYNGTVLWDLRISSSTRLPGNRCGGTMALQDDYLYTASGNHCLALAVRTGEEKLSFALPALGGTISYDWGHVSVVGDVLLGSAIKPGSIRAALLTGNHSLFQGGPHPYEVSDYLFAYGRHDAAGFMKWKYTPRSGVIVNTTIASALGKVFFMESTNPANRTLDSCKFSLPKLYASGSADIVALDTGSGTELWRKSRDFRKLEYSAYMIFSQDKLIVTGCNFADSILYYHVYAFDAASGDSLWAFSKALGENGSGHGETQGHPVVAGNAVYLTGFGKGFAVNLENGQEISWTFKRDGWGCGPLSASKTYFFYRGDNPVAASIAANPTYPRPHHLTTVTRSGCGINIIPAGGLINIPEGSSGCGCNNMGYAHSAVQTSLAFLSTLKMTADTQGLKITMSKAGGSDLFLSMGYPNPFNPNTTIRFSIPAQAKPKNYSLVIYNALGQVVHTLAQGTVGREGIRNRLVQWRGVDGNGNRVGSGVYFYRLTCGVKSAKGSLVMIQ